MHTSQMRSYEVARKVSSILEFIAWAAVAIGVLAAIGGLSTVPRYAGFGAGLLAAVPGVVIVLFGLLMVGIVQHGRAAVDSAEYGQQALQIARDQLEISRRSLKLQLGAPATGFGEALAKRSETPGRSSEAGVSFADLLPAGQADSAQDDPTVFQPIAIGQGFIQLNEDASELEYRDRIIRKHGGKFNVDGLMFDALDRVRVHIDRLEDDWPRLGVPDAVANSTPGEEEEQSVSDMNVVLGVRNGLLKYSGRDILVQDGAFYVNGQRFRNLHLAQLHVDQLPGKPDAEDAEDARNA